MPRDTLPAHLAAYIARGVSAIEPFDLPAVLDALRLERDRIMPPERRGHISVVIAEIEHALNQTTEATP